jgi:hypothetical protein
MASRPTEPTYYPRRAEYTLAGATHSRLTPEARTDAGLGSAVEAFLVGQAGEQYPLLDGENTIGRDGSNMIHLADDAVSRYQAVIEVRDGEYEYMDWQAERPSEINGRPLGRGERHLLRPDNEIRIGATLLRFTTTP